MTDEHTPLIDSHFHLWRQDQPLTDSAWHSPPTDAPMDEYVKMMDERGIIFGVIAAASIHGEYNDYVRRALRKYQRFRATAVLSPTTSIYQLEQMKAEGFVGVRLMWALSDEIPNIDTGDYRMHFRRLRDLNWHAHLVDRPERLERSIEFVERSGVRLVIDHLGYLETPEGVNHPAFKAILAAIERGNTWVKISCKFRIGDKDLADQFAEQLMRVGGADRILWGSDSPFASFEDQVNYDSVLADYYHLVPDPAKRRKIDETAIRFYFT